MARRVVRQAEYYIWIHGAVGFKHIEVNVLKVF